MKSTRYRTSAKTAVLAVSIISAASALAPPGAARNLDLASLLTHKEAALTHKEAALTHKRAVLTHHAAVMAQTTHAIALWLERDSRTAPLTMTCPFALLLLFAARRRRAAMTLPGGTQRHATRAKDSAIGAERA